MTRESFLNRDKVKGNPSYRRAKKQERQLATRLGGKTTIASGSKGEKGDVRVRGLLRVEAKTTKHRSFSVTLDMIHAIEMAALGAGEIPAIIVEFNDGEGRPIAEVAVIPTYVLDDLVAGGGDA